jgi:hypothetical protein
MSFVTPDPSVPTTGRKRTATQRATENGDPLVVNKKARDNAKKAPEQASFSTNLLRHLLLINC